MFDRLPSCAERIKQALEKQRVAQIPHQVPQRPAHGVRQRLQWLKRVRHRRGIHNLKLAYEMTLLIQDLDTIIRKIDHDPATDGILPFICCAPAFLIRLVPHIIGVESGQVGEDLEGVV